MAGKIDDKGTTAQVDAGVLAGFVDNTYKRFDDSVEAARQVQLFINYAKGLAGKSPAPGDLHVLPLSIGAAASGSAPSAELNAVLDAVKANGKLLAEMKQTLGLIDRNRGSVETMHGDIKGVATAIAEQADGFRQLRADLAQMGAGIEQRTGQSISQLSRELRSTVFAARGEAPSGAGMVEAIAAAMEQATTRMVGEVVAVLREWVDQRPGDELVAAESRAVEDVDLDSDDFAYDDFAFDRTLTDVVESTGDGEVAAEAAPVEAAPAVMPPFAGGDAEQAGLLRLDDPDGPVRLFGLLVSRERVAEAGYVIEQAKAAKAAGQRTPVTDFKLPKTGWKKALFHAVLDWQETDTPDDAEVVRALADVDVADSGDVVVSPEPEAGADTRAPIPLGGTKEMNEVVLAFIAEKGGKVTARQVQDMLESRYKPSRSSTYSYYLLNSTPGVQKKGGVWHIA